MIKVDSELRQILITDLDGTLIKTDMLWESLVRLVFQKPYLLPLVIMWAARGRPYLKQQLARHVDISIQHLPFNHEVLAHLKQKKLEGFELILASASNEKWVQAVARAHPIFDQVFASTETLNLKGQNKLTTLQKAGIQSPHTIEYIGDSTADFPLWSSFPRASLVGSDRLRKQVQKVSHLERHFVRERLSLRLALKSLRVHQWAKNVLVFAPLLLIHSFDPGLWIKAVLTFFALSFLASATYIVNDLADLDNDRAHQRKRDRPLASGRISIPTSLAIAFPLAIVAFAMGLFSGIPTVLGLCVYLSVTLAYSFKLKRLMVWDVVVLSFLYTLRILIGAYATATPVSHWLLAFSVLAFTGLALLKRTIELVQLTESQTSIKGRSYVKSDLLGVGVLGACASFSSLVVFLIYIGSDTVREHYSRPDLLFASSFALVFWYLHLWIRSFRGEVHDDPVLFAMKDPTSLMCIGLMAACAALAV